MLKGISSVFRANVLNKAISLLVTILIVRVLSQTDYGIFSSINNKYNLFVLLNGMGTISGVLLYGSEKRAEKDKQSYFKLALATAFAFNLFVSMVMFFYGYLKVDGIVEGNIYFRKLAFLPMLDYLMQFFQTLMRCKQDNEKYSTLLSINSLSYSVFMLTGALLWGIDGAILGRYISVLLCVLLGAWFSREQIQPIIRASRVKKAEAFGFWKYSLGIGLTAAVSTAYYLIDVFLVEYLLQDAVLLANYKAATIIPDNLIIIPTSIIVAVIPMFAEHNDDKEWMKKHFKKILLANGMINLVIVGILVVIAPWFIPLIWGVDYKTSIVAFQILCCSHFMIGTFKTLCTNVLNVTRRVKEALTVSLVSLGCNVIFDIIFIKAYGMNGAAIATFLVAFVASIVSLYQVRKVFVATDKGNKGEVHERAIVEKN